MNSLCQAVTRGESLESLVARAPASNSYILSRVKEYNYWLWTNVICFTKIKSADSAHTGTLPCVTRPFSVIFGIWARVQGSMSLSNPQSARNL